MSSRYIVPSSGVDTANTKEAHMAIIYHSGELAVQARAGVQAEAESLRKGIGASMKPSAQDFLQNQRLAIASTVGSDRVWASALTGKSGFIQVVTEQIVQINAAIVPGKKKLE